MAARKLRQLQLLLWKNWLFSLRSWKSTLLQLLAPCFFLLLVTALSYLPQGLEDVLDPPVTRLGRLPKCQAWNKKKCISLLAIALNLSSFESNALVPIDDPTKATQECVTELVTKFANVSGMTFGEGEDVQLKMSLKEVIPMFFNMSNNGSNYFYDHTNQTQTAVIFMECTINKTHPSASKLNYTILYNASRALRFAQLLFGSPDKPDGRTEVALLLDQLFLSAVMGHEISVSANVSSFPIIFQQPSVVAKQAEAATTFLFCAITFQFVIMMYNIVSEKDLKLRQGLKLIGLKDSVYWMSWAITGLVLSLACTIVLLATGYACQLKFFLNSNIVITFLLFFTYSASMIPLAFFVSVFIRTVRQAVTTGMLVFVVGLMIISILSNSFILTQMYEYVRPLVIFLAILPPFHLAKAMADIGIAASDTDINGLSQVPYHYGWRELGIWRKVLVFEFGDGPNPDIGFHHFSMPPTYYSLLFLFLNALFYGIVAWYLDSVVRGNHGIPRKWHFLIDPAYWSDMSVKRGPGVRGQPRGAPYEPREDSGASDGKERNGERASLLKTRTGVGADGVALRIQDLSKTFGSICQKRKQPAVDSLSLSVHEHQILALLGHNGAGKSTTINMLTGLLEMDSGDASFYGLSVKNDLDSIHSILGVCPQHDVLWGDLTAREHMQLFASLKEIPLDQIDDEIKALLHQVQLLKVANHRVKTFSGGMKRRLSVALSFLGDPMVIFLDEPTTGMDPRIRRDIWNLILRMKRNRVTIMTTHSMEEADILGDSIAIMANGSLKVTGTSVNLKNRFAGYIIELITGQRDSQAVQRLVKENLPGASPKSEPIEVEDGRVLLSYSLPSEFRSEIGPFFKLIESDSNLALLIIDYSISQTTLEEVFLNVTMSEYFKDQEYKPVLMRSGSYSAAAK